MEFKRSDMDELTLLLNPSKKKKCEGHRSPPCGRGSNCKGFEKGIRCGAHDTCSHEDKDLLSDGHVGEHRRGKVGGHHWAWE